MSREMERVSRVDAAAPQPVVVVGGCRPQAPTVLMTKFGELHQMLTSTKKMGVLGLDFHDTQLGNGEK